MTPAGKVGQLIQADIESITPGDLRHYPLGSVLNGGDVGPGHDKLASPREWLKLADRFYEGSTAAPHAVAVMRTRSVPGSALLRYGYGLTCRGRRRQPQ